jgi:hypothetical protein
MLIACHHPPASIDSNPAAAKASPETSTPRHEQSDSGPTPFCRARPTSTSASRERVDRREIPYVVAGSGGFAATRPIGGLPETPVTVGEYTLDKPPIVDFGYLTVTVDMTGRDHHLTIEFHDRTNTHMHDITHLNLRTGKILRR